MVYFAALAAAELGLWGQRYGYEPGDADLPGTTGWSFDQASAWLISNGYVLGYSNSQVQPFIGPVLPYSATAVPEPVPVPVSVVEAALETLPVGGDMTMQPGADLRDGGPGNPDGFIGPVLPSAEGGIGWTDIGGGASTALTLAVLGAKFKLPPLVIAAIAAAGGGAAVLGWDSMPEWVKGVLIAAGVVAGTSLVISGVNALTGGNGTQNGLPVSSAGVPGIVVGSWIANGSVFYRLSDGRFATQKKTGVWKTWRMRRGTMIYSNGATSLNSFLRADKALNKQSKRIEKVLNRRTKPRTKPRK